MPINSNPTLRSLSSPISIADKAVQLFSTIQSGLERRNAVRYKVAYVLDHKFQSVILTEPTYCSQCRDFIWGLVGQECKQCKLACHKKCLNVIDSACVAGHRQLTQDEDTQGPTCGTNHKFKLVFFWTPTFCNHCGIMIKGITNRQGLACSGCSKNVHYDCKDLVCFKCCRWVDKRTNLEQTSSGQPTQTEAHNRLEPKVWAKINIQDFELIKLLGTGTFSKVYLAKLKASGQEFAIKAIKKTNLVVNADPDSALTEMRVLSFGRQYPFLAIAHCCFQSEDRLYFVMEHVVGRDLVYHISKARKFSEDRTRFYVAEIVLALSFLHSQGVVYRDLKLDNVILDKRGHCKLLDFGMSKELCKTDDNKARTFCGTPHYISPEIIRQIPYGKSVDWWSLGVLMFEMLIGSSPFDHSNHEQLYDMILNEDVDIPLFLSVEARSVLDGLLTKDPQNRLGCRIMEGCEEEIKEHPFFWFKGDGDSRGKPKWDEIEAQRIKPPYVPNHADLEQCDSRLDEAILTPVSRGQLKEISHEEFDGFSFYSESFQSMAQLS